MSRFEDALLGKGIAMSRGRQHRMLDPKYGGQGASYAPLYEEYVSSAMHRRQHLVGVLLQGPRAFEYIPDGERWLGMLKAIVERHAQTYEGLVGTTTASMTPNQIGGAGQRMNEVMNITEETTNVVMTFIDRDGMPIANFFREYHLMFMMDPGSKFPNIVTYPGARTMTDWLPDMYTFAMLFYEPNHLHNQVVNAWVVAGMMPETSGDILGSMDKQSDLNNVPLNITFGGLSQYGTGPAEFAQGVLMSMDITGAQPAHRKSFISKIDADVLAINNGFKYSMETVGRNQVNL